MPSDAVDSLSGQASSLDIDDGHSRPPGPISAYGEDPPPAPQIHSKGVVATDITAQFIQSAEQLSVGQLIKENYFTLFESVGAIEIMDPKMDTGYLAEGETMEDEYDVSRNLLPEEVLGVIDQLLCLEMAWHMGHPLSQTIFTSLYVDHLFSMKPIKLEALFGGSGKNGSPFLEILGAYCVGMIKTCWHVNNRVKSEHFYEEEDFVTHTYNRTLLEEFEDETVLQSLEAAQKTLSLQNISSELCDALMHRLKFRVGFLCAVAISGERSSSSLKSSWITVLALLPGLKAARDISKSVPEAFSDKVQRKLASTVPPRPVVIVSFDAAYEHLERLCLDGQKVTEVLKYYDSQSLITFVALFQARKPQPSVYIRTLLQHYIFGDMMMLGTMSIRQVLDDDLSMISLAEDQLLDRNNDEIEVPFDPRFNMAKRMEIFRARAAQSFLDVLRTLCQNRCRIRRTLKHSVSDWDNLQLDAEELDLELRDFTKEQPTVDSGFGSEPIFSFPLSSWSYFYKLRQMEWIVQMGFELEVYQPDELAGMYWYLEHLTTTRVRHLERIRMFTMHRFTVSSAGKKRTPPKELGFGRALSFLNFSMLEATATQGFADALSCLYVVLGRLSLIRTPDLPYSDATTRYELRMKPFLPVSLPEFMPYENFVSSVTQPEESTLDLIQFSADAAGRARKDFELLGKLDGKTARCLGSEEAWMKNVKDCLKSCIMASISIAAVRKAVDGVEKGEDITVRVELPQEGKGYHDWWIVPKILPK